MRLQNTKSKEKKLSNKIISQRTFLQIIIGAVLYFTIVYFHISLWYVLGLGVVIGIVFGKVFCRWMCPLGLIMEFMMGLNPSGKFQQMYMYHKIGCPIAWIEGFMNKTSLFQITFNQKSCINCGLCDKKCYISTFEPTKYSLYKPQKLRPGASYTCSKCLSCVESCPTGSLKYKFEK